MLVDLPPPPAPLVARLEASFPLPAALRPYEYLWAGEGKTSPEIVPVRQFHGEEPENLVRLSESALANPIKLLLDRLGFAFRTLVLKMAGSSNGGESGGLGDGADPVPPGDPIPVDGGGRPGG